MAKRKNTVFKPNKIDLIIFTVCSLGALTSLTLYYKDVNSFSVRSNEKAIARIYSSRNTVQRKFIDNDIWEKVNAQSLIYDGDKIRTAAESELEAEFEEKDTKIQLKENSLIQIFSSKNEKSIDFLSGEILLSSEGSKKNALVRTGSKKISAAPKSKVKIVISKSQPEKKVPEEAFVEVLDGEVKIYEEKTKKNSEKSEEKIEVLKAGEKSVLKIDADTAKNSPETENAVAQIENVAVQTEMFPDIEEESEKNSVIVEDGERESVSSEEKNDGIGHEEKSLTSVPAADSEEGVKGNLVNSEAQNQEEKEIPEKAGNKSVEVKEGETASKKFPYIMLTKNVYNQKTGSYNYHKQISLRELIGPNKKLPEGTVIDLEMSGIPENSCYGFAVLFSNTGTDAKEASAYMEISSDDGKPLAAGIPFKSSVRILLKREIKNTNRGALRLSYEPAKFDQELKINDFELTARIVTLDVDELLKQPGIGYNTSFSIDSVTEPRVKWNDGQTGFELSLPTAKVWDKSKTIPAGTKIKLSLHGKSDSPLKFMDLQLFNCEPDTWHLIQTEKICGEGAKDFAYSEIITLKEAIEYSDASAFKLTFDTVKREKEVNLSDLKIKIEFLEH